jgi:dUTP pyrophosphatase
MFQTLKVRVKRIGTSEMPLPKYETAGAAGMDVRADLLGLPVTDPHSPQRDWVNIWNRRISEPGPRMNQLERVMTLAPGAWYCVPTGLAFAVPEGWEGSMRARSGLAAKHAVEVIGSRTIDSDYRGELKVIVINLGITSFTFAHGERIGQLVFCPAPQVELELVDELDATARGTNGLGHTGTR